MILVTTVSWFSLVSLVLSHPRINRSISKVQHQVERVMGVALIGLGIKVALPER